jgi:hypothetical protein
MKVIKLNKKKEIVSQEVLAARTAPVGGYHKESPGVFVQTEDDPRRIILLPKVESFSSYSYGSGYGPTYPKSVFSWPVQKEKKELKELWNKYIGTYKSFETWGYNRFIYTDVCIKDGFDIPELLSIRHVSKVEFTVYNQQIEIYLYGSSQTYWPDILIKNAYYHIPSV